MASILAIFNRLQQGYTYRKRFLFFALIYFIATPYPTYWMVRTQKAQISQINQKEWGLQQIEILSGLFNALFIYQTGQTQLTQDNEIWKRLQQRIANTLRMLQKSIEEYSSLSIQTYGDNFTVSHDAKSSLQDIYNKLHEFLVLNNTENFYLVTSSLVDSIENITLNTGLTIQNNDKTINYLANLYVTVLKGQKKILFGSFNHLKSTLDDLNLWWKGVDKLIYNHSTRDLALLGSINGALSLYQDGIKNIITAKNIPQAQMQSIIENSNRLQALSVRFISRVLSNSKSSLEFQSAVSYWLVLLCIFLVFIFVAFRLLTRHLISLMRHIASITKGDFSKKYYPHSGDEFANVGLTLNEVASSIADIAGKIHSLGLILVDSSQHLTYDISTHEANVTYQESSIMGSEQRATKIANDARDHANIINTLSHSAMRQPLTKSTLVSLEQTYQAMQRLKMHSHETLFTLKEIQQQVDQAGALSHFMDNVSNEARQLSLNAAIEANSPQEFQKITHAIQRFSETTAQATENIRHIFSETSTHIESSYGSVKECLLKIDEGSSRLKTIKSQLTIIVQQANLHVKTFEELNRAMQLLPVEAEGIIDAIIHVRQNAQATTEVFHFLNKNIQQLGSSTRELKPLVNIFVRGFKK